MKTYLEIVPEYSDPDTFCTFTVSNGSVRAALSLYADMEELHGVVAALLDDHLVDAEPHKLDPFTLTEENCMNISFQVIPGGSAKVLRTTIVNDIELEDPYRAQIDISLTNDEAKDLANDLKHWIASPDYHFLWRRMR